MIISSFIDVFPEPAFRGCGDDEAQSMVGFVVPAEVQAATPGAGVLSSCCSQR